MMGLGEMQRLADEAAIRARRKGTQPFLYQKVGYRGQIPFVGGHVPEGWERTDREALFVDTSGFGAPDEPALTTEQMFAEFKPGYGYALIEIGQFQGYVGEFREKQEVTA